MRPRAARVRPVAALATSWAPLSGDDALWGEHAPTADRYLDALLQLGARAQKEQLTQLSDTLQQRGFFGEHRHMHTSVNELAAHGGAKPMELLTYSASTAASSTTWDSVC